jgi:hypothetical protein
MMTMAGPILTRSETVFRKYPPARTIHPSSRSPYSGHTNALCLGKVYYKSSAAQRITY